MLAIFKGDFLLGHSSKFPLHMEFYVGTSSNYWSLLEQFNVLEQDPRPNILFWALALTIVPQNSDFSLPFEKKKWGFDF